MGAIQGSINGMIGAAAIGIGAAKKLDSSITKDQSITDKNKSEINQNAIEAAEKQAESEAYKKAAEEIKNNPDLNMAQFISRNKQATLAGNEAYQTMLQVQQGLTVKKKSLLDLI